MAQGEDFSLQSNSRTQRITEGGEQENEDREHHQSLLSYCAKCNPFSENEFLVGTAAQSSSAWSFLPWEMNRW